MWFSKRLRRINTVLTVVLGLLMLIGGVSTATSPPITDGTLLSTLLGSTASLLFFGIVFVVLGVGILYGFFRKKKKMYQYSLMFTYLICFFTALLELVVAPGTLSWIDNTVIAAVAAWLWLWWKNVTEYIDLKYFQGEVATIRFDEKDD